MDQPTREVRVASETWPLVDMELRATGGGLSFSGYAAVFDSPSEPLPFIERIRPGAFAKSLKQGSRRAVKMFLNHNSDIVLASTRKGSLTLTEDAHGLLAEASLPDNEWGRPVADAIERGDIDSMSFGFQVVRDRWNDDQTERELVEVRLFEVSPVTGWPAYPATSAAVRELAEEIEADADDLAAAFRALRESDTKLTAEQHALLVSLINARTDSPLVGGRLAEHRERWAGAGHLTAA